MATRYMAEAAQTAPESEIWTPTSRTAQSITGRVTFTPTQITFQNGKSLPLVPGGQILFRPEPKKKPVMADLYKVTSPDDPVLENGNKLCKGTPVSYLIVWKSEKVGHEADPRTLAPFPADRYRLPPEADSMAAACLPDAGLIGGMSAEERNAYEARVSYDVAFARFVCRSRWLSGISVQSLSERRRLLLLRTGYPQSYLLRSFLTGQGW